MISGKGGVGKTTTVANLGTALVNLGKNVIIIDGNVTTPNLSLHLGIPFYKVTLHDVLKGKVRPEMAIYEHSGLKIIPASLSAEAVKDVNVKKLESTLWNLLGKADIIIIDAAAGLGKEALSAIEIADELIIITNPELPAVTDALKTIKLAQDFGTKVLGVIVNRVKGHKYELNNDDIESMLEVPVIATVPEDINVPKSIANKKPVVNYKPRSKASQKFKKLAANIIGEKIEIKKESLIKRLFPWLT